MYAAREAFPIALRGRAVALQIEKHNWVFEKARKEHAHTLLENEFTLVIYMTHICLLYSRAQSSQDINWQYTWVYSAAGPHINGISPPNFLLCR